MKKYKALHIINTIGLGAIFPFVVIFKDYFFFSKNSSMTFPALILFFSTFVCGGIILIKSLHSGLGNGISLQELKLVDKPLAIYIIICLVAGNALGFLFTHDGVAVFYLICSLVSSGFIAFENVKIKEFDIAPFYKLLPPWYVYAFPFLIVPISAVLEVEVFTNAEYGDIIMIGFIVYAVFLVLTVWGFPTYVVDEMQKSLELDSDTMNLFARFKKGAKDVIRFKYIKNVRKQGIFYVIEYGDYTVKIPRFYSGTKRLIKLLKENGVSFVEL